MKNCDMVKDLLPLVAEDLASEESAAFVKEHLEICEDCRKAYEEMKTPVESEPAAPIRTVRRQVKRRGLLIAGLIACLVAALLMGAFTRLTKPIALQSAEEAFSDVSIVPETIPIVKETHPECGESDGTEPISDESDVVKQAQLYIVWNGMLYDEKTLREDPDADKELNSVGFAIRADVSGEESSESDEQSNVIIVTLEAPKEEMTEGESSKYVVYEASTYDTDTLKPNAVITATPKTLVLTANPEVQYIHAEQDSTGIAVYAATSLWRQWFQKEREPVKLELDLTGVDAVFFEPFNDTEHEVLYQREGYTPEAGFALPRLVMNYYFIIALMGTIALAVVWLILRILKKQKASSVFGVLVIIAASGVLAFLFAGFPSTTIEPLRDLIFVCIIAVLLIGAGLCGRKLFGKE